MRRPCAGASCRRILDRGVEVLGLLEARKFDDHDAVRTPVAFEHAGLSAAGDELAAEFGDGARRKLPVVLVFDRIGHFDVGDQVSGHGWRPPCDGPPLLSRASLPEPRAKTMIASAALIVAAGRGLRAGKGLPKQYRPIAGRPMLRHSLETFIRHSAIAAVRVVIDPDDRTYYDEAARNLQLLEPIAGGATRQDSVRHGLESLADLEPERVLIHDGAR